MNFGLDSLKKLESPKGMTNDDKLCDTCFTKLPKNEKGKKQEFCFQCNKKIRRFSSFELSALKKEKQPKGMTNDDRLCHQCYSLIVDKEKNTLKALEEEQNKKLDRELGEIKKNFRERGPIKYQDEYCAIVSRLGGKNGELVFAHAFSKLTKEGYRLMAQDEGSSLNLGIGSAGLNSFYFFQKIEYITLRNDEK